MPTTEGDSLPTILSEADLNDKTRIRDTGQQAHRLDVSKIFRPRVLKRTGKGGFSELEHKFLDDARQDLFLQGVKNPTNAKLRAELEKNETLTKIQAGERINLVELAELGLDKTDIKRTLTKDFARSLKADDILTRAGVFEDPSGFADNFGLDPETGEISKSITDAQAAISNLESGALSLINQGSALVKGDFSDPLARDFLQSFNEAFTTPFGGMGDTGYGPGVELQRAIGGRMAALNFGLQQVGAGINQLGVANPLAMPANQLMLEGQQNQTVLGNVLLKAQFNSLAAAERAATGGRANIGTFVNGTTALFGSIGGGGGSNVNQGAATNQQTYQGAQSNALLNQQQGFSSTQMQQDPDLNDPLGLNRSGI